jgi:prophage regulatory protein
VIGRKTRVQERLGTVNYQTSPKIERLPEVLARTGLKRSTLYVLIRKQEFPRPVPLSARAVGWLTSAVDRWIEERVAKRDLAV